MFVFLCTFFGYLVAIVWVDRKATDARATVLVILLFAVAFRATLLFSKPVLSFDLYRYYWEGKVVANGFNPYLYSADSETLHLLRDSAWELVSHKNLSTGYPPFMEMFLGFVYACSQSVFSYKIVFLAFDLASVAVVFMILGELGLARKNVIVYAWAPLPVLEISQTGHNDSVAVFLVLLSFLFLFRSRHSLSAFAMGLSVVTKLYPIFFAPILLRRWGVKSVGVFLGTIALCYLPFASIGTRIFEGLLYPINTSFFNGSIFPAIVGLYDRLTLFANPGFAAQVTVYLIYLAILLRMLFRSPATGADVSVYMRTSFLLVCAVLLLNRSFFPWYMMWVIPFLSFYRSRAWLLLSGTIFLSYAKYDSLPPPPYEGVDPLVSLLIDLAQYVPFYSLLVYELLAGKIRLRTLRGEKLRETGFSNGWIRRPAISLAETIRKSIQAGRA